VIRAGIPFAIALETGISVIAMGEREELRLVTHAALLGVFALLNLLVFRAEIARVRKLSRLRIETELRTFGRPLICTEYLARGNGSTFEAILPILKKERVGAYNWGLVDGKTNTKYPWPTWQMPSLGEPDPWHHEIFHTDGKPYRDAEVKFIKQLTSGATSK
jgi:hypothetical protein